MLALIILLDSLLNTSQKIITCIYRGLQHFDASECIFSPIETGSIQLVKLHRKPANQESAGRLMYLVSSAPVAAKTSEIDIQAVILFEVCQRGLVGSQACVAHL